MGRGGQDAGDTTGRHLPELYVCGIERLQSEVLCLAMISLKRYPYCPKEKLGKEVRK